MNGFEFIALRLRVRKVAVLVVENAPNSLNSAHLSVVINEAFGALPKPDLSGILFFHVPVTCGNW